jgi:hypothetical protein
MLIDVRNYGLIMLFATYSSSSSQSESGHAISDCVSKGGIMTYNVSFLRLCAAMYSDQAIKVAKCIPFPTIDRRDECLRVSIVGFKHFVKAAGESVGKTGQPCENSNSRTVNKCSGYFPDAVKEQGKQWRLLVGSHAPHTALFCGF